MVERRDNWKRSQAYVQVVAWLKRQQKSEHMEGLPPTLDPVIADRILRRLAVRGLAKQEAGRWSPTPALTQPTTIKKSES
jgi:hypothetical protein